MITPRFRLEQTDDQLKIFIDAPYVNVKDTEIHILDDDFRFYSAPYYLRLTLPGYVVENENSVAKYESDTHSFAIEVDKQTPGQFFPNLEMLTVMLQPKGAQSSVSQRPLIEVLSSSGDQAGSTDEEIIEGDEWFIEQTIDESLSLLSLSQHKYGFASLHSGLYEKYEVELSEVAEIRNPDAVSPKTRRELRESKEKEKFSDEHYLVDLIFTPEITQVLKMKLKARNFNELTAGAREQMKNLGNREFLLEKPVQRRCYLSMIDILFAFLYDYRITNGSHCIESAWNISRISSTLCWFEVFDNVNDMVRSCMRRSLCYPLYRHWGLSKEVFADILKMLELGNVGVLTCFLKIHSLFKKREPYYLLNQLYIEEYCVWVQRAKEDNIRNLIPVLSQAVDAIEKKDVDFDLVELEAAGQSEQEEMEIAVEGENQISHGISRMHL